MIIAILSPRANNQFNLVYLSNVFFYVYVCTDANVYMCVYVIYLYAT